MANPEHLEILQRGVGAWNEWREKNPEIHPYLNDADLSGADLGGAYLRYAQLGRANLRHANLGRADLIGALLNGADLINTDLSRADLRGVKLGSANLRGANLRGANLLYANLHHPILRGADFTNSDWGGTTLAEVDLSEVRGLETVLHNFPSTIGIDTVYKSQGNIPEVFLRGCGVPEDFIIYMRSLVVRPIQFYTCFISFTEADGAFSERLYNDLQAKGVRCWRWKEDARWGKSLMRSVDEAVRLYDKLVVVCSEQSLNAPAVIREVERALQKEDDLARRGKEGEVLFPIRLDDYIFAGWQHHRKADVTAKTVGDFRQWENHDSYRKAFDRLLRDLKAEDGPAAGG